MWPRSKLKPMYRAFVLIVCTTLIAVAVATVYVNKSKCREKLIIDTDAGVDDAVAILLILEAQKNMGQCIYDVVAITCSYGNTNEKQVEINVRKTLTVANRSDIAIYAGANRPILHKYEENNFFGKDGFGDYKFDDEILGKVDYSMPASVAMIELSKTYEGNLNILTIGPTTNVALAGSLDTGFFDRVKHFYVMGSSVAGVGNIRPGVEFNFAADPEANYVLLDSLKNAKLTLFPLEAAVNMNSGYIDDWRKNAFNDYDSKMTRFLNGIEAKFMNTPPYIPVDPMAATALLLGDKFVKKSIEAHVEAVVDGAARGAVLVDYAGRIEPRNARIILSVDTEVYKRIFLCAFTNNCNELK